MKAPTFSSHRSAVYARGGMVAVSQPLAAAAGIEILSQGGNAADAAVAVAAALNVTEPTSTGIGGDMFALFFDAKTKQISALNGSGRAPAVLTLERLKKEGMNELPPFHPYTITVPGACAGWCDLIQKHGTKNMVEILAPAIKLAEEGFPVAPMTSYFWQRGAQRQLASAPNGKGITALIALNLLEGFDLSSLDPISADRLHLEIEAMRLAFADARSYVADPKFSNIPIAELLSKEYANERRKLIDPRHATIDQKRGTPVSSSDTVYFSVADKFGNACSFINSNYMGFGTGIVPKGWGFTLQNRGHNFNLEENHPNVLAPRKRPYHTIIPAMATRESDGSLYASFGVMGGFMQPQGHMQVFVALVDSKLDPQSALDLPRFCIDDGTAGGAVALEEGIPDAVMVDLTERGHKIQKVAGWDLATFGRGQIILRYPQSKILCAGSDPRADGLAMPLI